tara:strand:+ start:275 stop:763 length:489 start_codon:yes stop_codon:yes gene_type:complete
MATKSSGFTLIELLVVVAILGVLSAAGIVSYAGYIAGSKQNATESTMQQISLAETEEYSNTSEYYTQTDCGSVEKTGDAYAFTGTTPTAKTTKELAAYLFEDETIIDKSLEYEMCVSQTGSTFSVIAFNKNASAEGCLIQLSAIGSWIRGPGDYDCPRDMDD